MAKKYENIEKIGQLISGGAIGELSRKISGAERSVSEVLKKLNELEAAARQKKAEAELVAKRAEEEAAAPAPAANAEEIAEVKPEPVKTEPAPETKEEKKTAQKAEVKKTEEPVKEAPAAEKAEKTEVKKAEPAPLPPEKQPIRPIGQFTPNKPLNGQKSYVVPHAVGQYTPPVRKPSAGKTFINSDNRPPRSGAFQPRPQMPRPVGGATRFTPAQAPVPQAGAKGKNFGPDKKKQSFEKTYVEKSRTINKRALVKQQGTSIADFDENKSGYRKLRVKKDKQKSVQTIKIEHAIVTTDDIPVKMLSEKIGITATVIVNRLFKEGVMTNVNGSIDYDTAALIAADFGVELEYKPEKTAEEVLFEQQADTVEEIEKLVPRAPVVTVIDRKSVV